MLIEFAIVAPLLLMLAFGVIDFGVAINHNTMINNAAREGAREGVFNPVAADIEAQVRSAASDFDQSKITVSVSCRQLDGTDCPGADFDSEAEAGGAVIVQVDYAHDFISFVPPMVGISSPHTISGTIEMKIE